MKEIIRDDTDAIHFVVERKQPDGSWAPPTDLAGATVRIIIKPVDAVGWTFARAGALEDAAAGAVLVYPEAGDFPGSGPTLVYAEVEFVLATGKVKTYKVRGALIVVDDLD